ncbi:MAG TPA: hypothetical protein VFA29_14320 [Candidatus Baltobacteraceae bacterium]|nr:hypothetical protein [Candidatus Baltobacteraceae bacterium]
MTSAAPPRRECAHHLLYRVGAHTLAVDVYDEDAAEIFESTFDLLRCEPSGRGANCSAAVRSLWDGRLHARFGRHALPLNAAARTPRLRVVYEAAREIVARCASGQDGSLALYGALIGTVRGAVLLLGPAGIGKSVLALHAALAGADFLGDETALLGLRTGNVAAVPRRPSLRESALEFLPAALRDRVSPVARAIQTERGRFWYALDETAVGVRPCGIPHALRAICLLNGRSQTFEMRPVPVRDALPAIVQRTYSRPRELAQLGAVRKAIAHVPCFGVVLGAPDESARALLEGIDRCA